MGVTIEHMACVRIYFFLFGIYATVHVYSVCACICNSIICVCVCVCATNYICVIQCPIATLDINDLVFVFRLEDEMKGQRSTQVNM